uniref:Uncharacterized protein n=1 Tax=Arundo donax TaxID=35708 RepID=A0A0A9AEE8_ARUDO
MRCILWDGSEKHTIQAQETSYFRSPHHSTETPPLISKTNIIKNRFHSRAKEC